MKAVLATDLSAASEATIHNETCLACLGRIGVEEIHLVTVIPANVHRGMPGIDFEKRRRRAIRSYERVIAEAGFDSEVHVVRGTPHRRIRGLAETLGASLTIVGSRGKSPLENRIIGSTARNLARTTETPLIVNRIERGTDEPSVVKTQLFRRMLYATDFSENADRAFESFSYLRHATKEVTLVHVETPKDPGDGDDPSDQLETLAAQLADWDIETRIEVRQGDPAAEILAVEEAVDPTTTLVGSRGRSRLRRLLIGSVSEDIVARAAGNVMIVPPS
ncbi:universal stress protein [Halorubrum vacuolatum]|uniref:Nucleotide-binding universal stress protein, UspA family n=1 Tax=Halorubrum vacuolatum TaxID=63740 RepID=A0A238WHR6_HALVU|nr:universal stress protein [Halorubrum vacuolatum]SNR46090.1 Nucleotide-binding universal stress protein, UspA family [Halorubrum vacuolatum]